MECLDQWYGEFRKTICCQDLSATSEIASFKSMSESRMELGVKNPFNEIRI